MECSPSYKSPDRYLSPVSTATVATVCPGPSSRAICSAPTTFKPLEVPTKIPSSRASRLVNATNFIIGVLVQQSRNHPDTYPFNVVRTGYTRRDHRRTGWFQGHNARGALSPTESSRNTHQHSGRPDSPTKGRDRPFGLFQQFLTDGLIAL